MKILVYLGTGGVGKTSVAAATALAQAREGRKSLVLTIDPAWRLRTALRLEGDALEQSVALDPPAAGELWAALLDVRATLDEAVRLYSKAGMAGRILNHPIYKTIADSLAGMQELMAVERIDQLRRRGFEHIVVDTAPSRHALEFLDKPMFFSDLVGSGWVKLVGRTYRLVSKTGMMTLGRKTIDLYARLESILGANLVRQILDFYSIFISIAEGYAERAQKTVALLKDPSVTEFRVVTTPQKAMRDARYFVDALRARNFHAGAMYVNRTWGVEPAGEPQSEMTRRLMEWYASVHRAHLDDVQNVRREFRGSIPHIHWLPELDRDVDGIEALEMIAKALEATSLQNPPTPHTVGGPK
ncbi:MAG: ArsA family ATPase [Bryobacteraceae bacterium]